MPNQKISDLPLATLAELQSGAFLNFQLPSGQHRKISLLDLVRFLGIRVTNGATAYGDPTLAPPGNNRLAFVTDAPRVGEATSFGSGTLMMRVALPADPNDIFNPIQWARAADSKRFVFDSSSGFTQV